MAENGVQQELQTVNNCDIGGLMNNDGPSSYGPPSPLTGCYLLIVLGEPHSHEHKDIILQRLLKGNSFFHICFHHSIYGSLLVQRDGVCHLASPNSIAGPNCVIHSHCMLCTRISNQFAVFVFNFTKTINRTKPIFLRRALKFDHIILSHFGPRMKNLHNSFGVRRHIVIVW